MKTKTVRQIHQYAIFRDTDAGPWICARELRKRIAVPANCRKIRFCLTRNEPDNNEYFDLNTNETTSFDTLLRGIRSQLTHNLKMWLAEGRQELYRYAYIDYEE